MLTWPGLHFFVLLNDLTLTQKLFRKYMFDSSPSGLTEIKFSFKENAHSEGIMNIASGSFRLTISLYNTQHSLIREKYHSYFVIYLLSKVLVYYLIHCAM